MANKSLKWAKSTVKNWKVYFVAGVLGLFFVHLDSVLHIINHFLSDFDAPGIYVFTSFVEVEFVLGISLSLMLIGLVLKIANIYNETWK